MSKFLKISLILAVLMLALAACTGGAPDTGAGDTGGEDAEPEAASGDITLWLMPNGADPEGAIQAEIDAFNAVNPNVNVTFEVVGWGDAYGRIQTAVQGGEGPCITQLGTTWVPTFGTMGGLYSFTADDLSAYGGEANFVPASWSTAGVSGQTYSIPWFADVRALTYRADVLEQVGLTPDEAFADIDSLISTLEAVRDAAPTNAAGGTIYPFQHPGRNDWNVWQNSGMWMWAYGGDFLNADGSQAVFNTAESVEGATKFFNLYSMGLTSPDTLELNSAQTDQRFGEGSVFAYITGPWVISNARDIEASGWAPEAAENLAFALFPAGPGGQYTFVGGSNLAIMNSCPNMDAAKEFVAFLTGNESQIRYANEIGMLPATLSAQNDAVFTEDPLFSVFIEAAQHGKSAINIPQWGQVETNLQTALQSLWEDVAAAGDEGLTEDHVKEELDGAAATVDSLLGQ